MFLEICGLVRKSNFTFSFSIDSRYFCFEFYRVQLLLLVGSLVNLTKKEKILAMTVHQVW